MTVLMVNEKLLKNKKPLHFLSRKTGYFSSDQSANSDQSDSALNRHSYVVVGTTTVSSKDANTVSAGIWISSFLGSLAKLKNEINGGVLWEVYIHKRISSVRFS